VSAVGKVHYQSGDHAACGATRIPGGYPDEVERTGDHAGVTCGRCRTTAPWKRAAGVPVRTKAEYLRDYRDAHRGEARLRQHAHSWALTQLGRRHPGELQELAGQRLKALRYQAARQQAGDGA
jgi:hypothetical protein